MIAFRAPTLTAAEARARAVLSRQGQDLPLAGGRLSLAPMPLADPPVAWNHTWTLQLEWGGAAATLRLQEATLRQLLEPALGDGIELPSSLPPALAALALEQGFATAVAPLAASGRGLPRLTGMAQEDHAFSRGHGQRHRIALQVQPANDPTRAPLTMELATDGLGLLLLAGALAQRPPAATFVDTGLAWPLRLRLGRARLPLVTLRALAVGDLLLMGKVDRQVGVDGTERCSVVAGASAWLGERRGTELRLLRPMGQDMDEPMHSPDTPTAETGSRDGETPSEAPVALARMPVSLSFELGLRTVTLEELQAFAPGTLVDLGLGPNGPVQVRAGGALVAEGELVEVDGRLGVAITRVGGP